MQTALLGRVVPDSQLACVVLAVGLLLSQCWIMAFSLSELCLATEQRMRAMQNDSKSTSDTIPFLSASLPCGCNPHVLPCALSPQHHGGGGN